MYRIEWFFICFAQKILSILFSLVRKKNAVVFFPPFQVIEMREGLRRFINAVNAETILTNQAFIVGEDEVAEHTHCDYSTLFFCWLPFSIFIHSKRSTAFNSSWTQRIFFSSYGSMNFFFVFACLSRTIKSCRVLIAAL